jgi:DNA-binding GntR family transcriptional regulator
LGLSGEARVGPERNIYETLRQRIVLMDYAPGRSLREKELAREFKTSRTPVREALLRLEAEGLVRIIPSSGTYVTEVSFQKIKNIIEVRIYLMGLVGSLAAARITEGEIKELDALVEKMKKARNPKSILRLDLQAHDLLDKATRNEDLVKVMGMFSSQIVRIWTFSNEASEYYEGLAREFEALSDALKKRDGPRCARLLERHAEEFVKFIKIRAFSKEFDIAADGPRDRELAGHAGPRGS